MNYMQQIDALLEELLLGEEAQPGETPKEHIARVKKAIKDKVLESYRNGQRDCPKCNPKHAAKPRADRVSAPSRYRA